MKIFTTLFLASTIALTGCATTQNSYGNFTIEASDSQQFLVSDSLKQIIALYPPAHTRLALQHLPDDAYGLGLIRGLRANGYAVIEYSEEQTQDPSAQPFSYVVDSVVDAGLDRLTINVGEKSISRAYSKTDSGYNFAGDWSRKE